MHILRWLLGGIVGGVIGVAIWVAMDCTLGLEFAWMAWPVGLLVGWGVHRFSAADTRGGILRGTLAALLALAAVLGAGWSKAEILTKLADQALTPAVVETSETNLEGQDGAGTSAVIERVTLEFEEPSAGPFYGAMESKPSDAFQNMDMLWLCLAALTAYVVGKGPGTGSKSRAEPDPEEPVKKELAGAEPPVVEPPVVESAAEAGDAE